MEHHAQGTVGMLTLYHYPSSPCAAKVRAVLSEKGLDWESIVVDIIEKKNLDPDYLALNPKGLVPVLVDGGSPLTESTIIMEYLDTAYARDTLKPAGALDQARMRRWCKWVDETQHPSYGGLAWTALVRPYWLSKSPEETTRLLDRLVDPARRARQQRLLEQGYAAPDVEPSLRTLDRTISDMEAALAESDFLVGHLPTLADLAVLPYVIAAEKFGLDTMFEGRPRVGDWLTRWRATPTWEATAPWDLDDGERDVLRAGTAAVMERISAER
jgi:glutathione S-transferase